MKRLDSFVLGLALVVALAFVVPALGAKDGPLHPQILGPLGVAVIYFGQGLTLTLRDLGHAGKAWQVHALVQVCTFLLFPLLGTLLVLAWGETLGPELTLGVAYLCALPSTITSSVTLTALAQGNVPLSMLNATLSSLLGIVLTPLLLGLSTHAHAAGPELGKVIADLSVNLALPFIAGQVLQRWLGEWARSHQRGLRNLDRGIILLLVFTSFADSVHTGTWAAQSADRLALAAAGSVGLFVVALGSLELACTALRVGRAERIAATFCGVTKSLATGVPMAQIVFGDEANLGPLLLPLLVYHPLQLLVCSGLASRWAAGAEASPRV